MPPVAMLEGSIMPTYEVKSGRISTPDGVKGPGDALEVSEEVARKYARWVELEKVDDDTDGNEDTEADEDTKTADSEVADSETPEDEEGTEDWEYPTPERFADSPIDVKREAMRDLGLEDEANLSEHESMDATYAEWFAEHSDEDPDG